MTAEELEDAVRRLAAGFDRLAEAVKKHQEALMAQQEEFVKLAAVVGAHQLCIETAMGKAAAPPEEALN